MNTTDNIQKKYAIAFFVLIYSIFIFLILGKIYPMLSKSAENSLVETDSSIDFSKLYPIQENTYDANDTAPVAKSINGYLEKYKNTMNIMGNIHSSLTYDILFKQELSQSSYLINMLLSDRNRSNYSSRLCNGYYSDIVAKESEETIDTYSNKYSDFNQYLSSQGIDFLYVQPPCKISKYDSQLEYGLVDYKNSNYDALVEALRKKGVTCLDLRDELAKSEIDHYSFFFRTDAHWNSYAGLWAAESISKYCNSFYGLNFNTDNLVRERYDIISFHNAMYGNQTYSIPKFIANAEHFDVLIPNFETNFSLEIPDKNIHTSGSFNDLFFDFDNLNTFSEKGGDYAYQLILKGNRPLVHLVNDRYTTCPKVLIIKDSFGTIASTYLSTACSELTMVDIRRYNGNFNGSVKQLISETKPDIVISILSFPTDDPIR